VTISFPAEPPTRLGDLTLLRQVRLHGKLHWVTHCGRCNSETTVSAYHLRFRKLKACKACVDGELREKPRAANTCSCCHITGHTREFCPDRPPRKFFCDACAGLSHRVLGPKCRTCGTRYAAEEPVERPELRIGQWSWT
jgi:hypothetical protein